MDSKVQRKMTCPHCGFDQFKRTCVDRVMIIDEVDYLLDEVVDADLEGAFFVCFKCGKDVTDTELTPKPLEKGDPYYEAKSCENCCKCGENTCGNDTTTFSCHGGACGQ